MAKKKSPPRVFAWAWMCDFGLCQWSQPDKKRLLAERPPSDEAIPVRVELVPVKTGPYRKFVGKYWETDHDGHGS